MAKPAVKTENKNTKNYIWSVGRRKRAIARVRLYHKDKKDNGLDVIVNDKPIGQYFTRQIDQLGYAAPFELTKTQDKYRVTAKVEGSGVTSQLQALMHAIARALVKADADHKSVLRANGLITRDDRKKQKRMIGQGGKARAKKQSPKR